MRLPLVGLLEQQRADKTCDRRFVGEDALQRIGRVNPPAFFTEQPAVARSTVRSDGRFPSERFRVIRAGKYFYEVHAPVRVARAPHASAPAASASVAPSAIRMVLHTQPSP